jgi:hypothetical protein
MLLKRRYTSTRLHGITSWMTMLQTFLCYVTYMRVLKKKTSQLKNKFVELAAFFYRLAVGRHASARAIIVPIHCHTRTHRAVSCHGNKKESSAVSAVVVGARAFGSWVTTSGRHSSAALTSAHPQHIHTNMFPSRKRYISLLNTRSRFIRWIIISKEGKKKKWMLHSGRLENIKFLECLFPVSWGMVFFFFPPPPPPKYYPTTRSLISSSYIVRKRGILERT